MTETQREKAMWGQEQKFKWCSCNPRLPRIDSHQQKLGRDKEGFSSASERVWPCQHLYFRFLAFQNCERINFYCFRPPNLWYFVMVSLGNLTEAHHAHYFGWASQPISIVYAAACVHSMHRAVDWKHSMEHLREKSQIFLDHWKRALKKVISAGKRTYALIISSIPSSPE